MRSLDPGDLTVRQVINVTEVLEPGRSAGQRRVNERAGATAAHLFGRSLGFVQEPDQQRQNALRRRRFGEIKILPEAPLHHVIYRWKADRFSQRLGALNKLLRHSDLRPLVRSHVGHGSPPGKQSQKKVLQVGNGVCTVGADERTKHNEVLQKADGGICSRVGA